jgi:toxin ParE1/3/4
VKYQIIRSFDARNELDAIADYTIETWGENQQRKYMMEIEATISKLNTNPEKQGKDCSDIYPGLRSISHESHYFIFYRVKEQTVEILRVLHQKRDWLKFFSH